jgi:hypothetical protein
MQSFDLLKKILIKPRKINSQYLGSLLHGARTAGKTKDSMIMKED